MSKLIIHGGLHKTGTSAIQHFLNSTRDALRSRGYYYPETEPFEAHHKFVARLKTCASLGEATREANSTLQSFRDLAPDSTIIISSEMICEGLDPRVFADLTKIFDTIETVFYVRIQDELIESAYNQQVKQSGESRRIDEYTPYFVDFHGFFEWWRKFLPKVNIYAFEYEKSVFTGGHLIADFCARVLDIPAERFDRPKVDLVNKSLSPVACAVLARLNHLGIESRRREKIIACLTDIFPQENYRNFTLLSPAQRQRIVDNTTTGNISFRTRYLRSGELRFKPKNHLIYLDDATVDNFMYSEYLLEKVSSILDSSVPALLTALGKERAEMSLSA